MNPQGLYSFWPPPPDEPRIQFLTSYRYSADVEPTRGALDAIVFGSEQRVLPIGKPYGVDIWDGRIYVCDITNPGVVILDLANQQTRIMNASGVDFMRQPTDLAIAPDGTKYVADRRRGRIFVFNADDRHVSSFGEAGLVPVSVAVHDQELYVADFQTQTILVFDRFTGQRIRSIGAPGGEEGSFIRPLGLDVDAEGNIYVTDAIRGRLQKFSPTGELIFARGEIADSVGNFVRPKHVAVDRDGIVYVVDAAFQNVQMFDAENNVLMFFGSPGSHPGAMSLPAGIAVYDDVQPWQSLVHPAFEAKRIIIVSNQFGLNKVAVYALGQLKEGRTIADIAPVAASVLPPPAAEEGGGSLDAAPTEDEDGGLPAPGDGAGSETGGAT